MTYISKDDLVKEIEKIIPNEPYPMTSETLNGAATYGKRSMCFKILDLINSLEVKEASVDLGDSKGDKSVKYILDTKTSEMKEVEIKKDKSEIDEEYKIGKWFTGLILCWIDAPSTLQAAHNHHGKNIVAIHLKNGGYRCCCVDDKNPITFSLAEGTPLVEGWHNK